MGLVCRRPQYTDMVMAIRTVAWALFFLGVIAVGWLSLAPQDAVPEVGRWDKLGHFLAYAVLAICGGVAFSPGRSEISVGVALIAYGCILEIAQLYIPGRSEIVADAIANGIGVVAGMIIVRTLRRILSEKVMGH